MDEKSAIRKMVPGDRFDPVIIPSVIKKSQGRIYFD